MSTMATILWAGAFFILGAAIVAFFGAQLYIDHRNQRVRPALEELIHMCDLHGSGMRAREIASWCDPSMPAPERRDGFAHVEDGSLHLLRRTTDVDEHFDTLPDLGDDRG